MDSLLTVVEAARLLGMTRRAVYMAIARRQIPYVKLGTKRVRFRLNALERYVAEREVAAQGLAGEATYKRRR